MNKIFSCVMGTMFLWGGLGIAIARKASHDSSSQGHADYPRVCEARKRRRRA